MSLRMRSIVGIVLSTVAAILFLKYADTQSPFAIPSHLYQENNKLMATGLPWWVMSGAIIGLVIGLSLIRNVRSIQLGAVNITITVGLVAFILTYLAFSGYALTLPTYLLVSVINFVLLAFLTILPAGAALVIISMLTSRPPRRSGWEIMPDELKAELLKKSAPPRKFPLLAWLSRHNPTVNS